MSSVGQPQTSNYWKLFKPAACSVGLKATAKDEVLGEIVANLVKGGSLDEALGPGAQKALQEREQLASTGVGMNVAIPHVKLAGIDAVVACLSVHQEGVEWAAVDGERVHVLFTVLRPEEPGPNHDPEKHLEMMRWIARLGRDRDFRCFALQATTRTQLVDLLKEMSAS